ncbi:hypothetical protein CPB83DRAFT_909509 [Crepidotus variabilis]|uniref:C2H2-type domain-containing protein n=1 Tax=Crepidotus variabilis TaxID=179855 RepID=A0A9P6E922_9AGAR|nr:hypothetical protein CPB83DRAFT_909509 [Crepidotus variabilis]
MHGHRASDPVDNVRRDAKDGAYHCPQCDTPFTRRSNLRRHFQIHTRNAVQKCENCEEEFANKQELQQHSSSCYSLTWNPSNDKAFRGLDSTLLTDTASDPTFNTNAGTLNAFLYGANYPSSTSLFPSFDTPETRYGTYGTNEFISPLPSPIGVMPSRTNSSNALDGNLGSLNSSLNTAFAPTRRPSSASSGSLSSSASPSPFSATPNMSQTSFPSVQTSYGWNGLSTSPMDPVDDYAFYSRQQVKEMIDVVSECLIDTMENVITRTGSASLGMFDSVEGQLVQNMRDAGFRQTVISEAMPRVFYRMQTRGNEQKPALV